MDIESVASGGGAGFLGAVLAAFGLNRRMNKLEDGKQDKVVCDAIHEFTKAQFSDLKEGQRIIFEQLKEVNIFLRNNKWIKMNEDNRYMDRYLL